MGPKTCARCNKPTLKRDLSTEGLCLHCHSTLLDISGVPLKKRTVECVYCDKPLKGDASRTAMPWHRGCRRQALEKSRVEKAEERQRLIEQGQLEPRLCKACGKPMTWGHGLERYHKDCKLAMDRLKQRDAQRRKRAAQKANPGA